MRRLMYVIEAVVSVLSLLDTFSRFMDRYLLLVIAWCGVLFFSITLEKIIVVPHFIYRIRCSDIH